jgi:hypothetical protein
LFQRYIDLEGMLRKGYANTVISATEAAFKHLMRGEERKATIEHRDGGGELISLTWTAFGIITTITKRAAVPRPGSPAAKKAISARKRQLEVLKKLRQAA